MRILQLIDSLRPGGAEKMAVHYANALAKRLDGSFLCCTRKEGLLKKQLSPEVDYIFLNKKNIFDYKAFLNLRTFVRKNNIDLIQAHSSSWFLALIVKLSLPGVKLVWHDHYGKELHKRKIGLLKTVSRHFDGIIAVNKDLEVWSNKNLRSREVKYIRNFLPESPKPGERVELKGGDSFKIICVANFRAQKDHLNLLKAFMKVLERYPSTTLHLLGKEEETSYSLSIRKFIEKNNLFKKVFIYGEQENVELFLAQADLGVLASKSEGLPLALLEYGLAGLPVICTNVGECLAVVGQNGIIVPPQNSLRLFEAFSEFINNFQLDRQHSNKFQEIVKSHYSEDVILSQVLDFFYYLSYK